MSELARRFGTPLYVYSSAAMARALDSYQRALRGRDHLLCYALKANSEPRRAAMVRAPRLRLRHRLRAASSSARSPPVPMPAASSSPASARRGPRWRARWRPASSASTSKASASSRFFRPWRRRADGSPASACASTPTSTPGRIPTSRPACAATSSASPTPAPSPPIARAAALPGIEVVGIDCHIGSQIAETAPYLEALDRLLDLVEAVEAARHRARPHRRRRRPRHHLRRGSTAAGRRAGRPAAAPDRCARPRASQAPPRTRPLAGRQRRRAASAKCST